MKIAGAAACCSGINVLRYEFDKGQWLPYSPGTSQETKTAFIYGQILS